MHNDMASAVLQKLEGRPLVIYAAGGGAEAIGDLQARDHCSRVLLDAQVPYSREAVRDLVGRVLRHTVLPDGRRVGGATSQEAAIELAWAAWSRAAELSSRHDPVAEARGLPIGAAVTCTLSGENSKRSHGDEAWLCLRTGPSGSDIRLLHIGWEMGQSDTRVVQSETTALVLLGLLDGMGIGKTEHIPFGNQWSTVETVVPARRPLPDVIPTNLLWRASADIWEVIDDTAGSTSSPLDPDQHYLLPGSFNPMTHAHVRAKVNLDKLTGKRGIFQISAHHPMKGAVPRERLNRVANALRETADLVVSADSGMHVEKARCLGLDIACGVDAVAQVSEAHMREIAAMGRRFIVVDRPGYELTPERAALLAELRFPRMSMNLDMSATKLREALKAA